MKKLNYIYAIAVGVVNSAIGAGGGMISVPSMKKIGLNQKQSQATTLAVILPLTIISVLIYAIRGDFSINETLKYIPFGLVGSVIGVHLVKKADNRILKIIFAVFMLWSGIRMFFR